MSNILLLHRSESLRVYFLISRKEVLGDIFHNLWNSKIIVCIYHFIIYILLFFKKEMAIIT